MRVVIRTGPNGSQMDNAYDIKTGRSLIFTLNGTVVEEIGRDSVLVTIQRGPATIRVTDAHPNQANAPPPAKSSGCGQGTTHQVKVPSITIGRGGDTAAAIAAKLQAICMKVNFESLPSSDPSGTVTLVLLPVSQPFGFLSYPPTAADAPRPGDGVTVDSFYPATVVLSTGSAQAPTTPAPPGQERVLGPAQITLSASTAPRGARVTVYGSGFQPGETVDIFVHATLVGSATVDSSGKFTQQITIPQSVLPGVPADISATGRSSIKTGTAPFSTS